jgi:hypothetical protein
MPAASFNRRVVYVLATLLPVWAIVAFFTGGVGWMLGPIRLSSRQPLRPLLIGLAIAGWYFWKYSRAEREDDGRWLHRSIARALPFTVPLLALLGAYLGIHYGSFAAAGSDSYGYVSQARLWLSGIPRVEQSWVQDFPWPNRDWAFTPLGYRPFSPDGTIVPVYPAGLPLMMAAFSVLLGENGPFYVVPVMAAMTVVLTYLLGKQTTGSGTVATLAALLLLASPVFVAHVMVPMSDVPAAAGWTLVAVLLLKQRPLESGIAAGLTLFIRPNLILLALLPAFVYQRRVEPLVRFAFGAVPGVVAIAVINTALYGDPLTTGYGSLLELYAVSSLPANAWNYSRWLVQMQTPLMLLAFVPIFVRGALRGTHDGVSPRACLAAIVGLTFLSYLFYATFEHWFYLRFLLPAYPALYVMLVATLRWLALRLPIEARVPAVGCVCALMILFGVTAARDDSVFVQAAFEQRHVRAAAEVAARTPADAMVLAVQHSGSVRYYANRITLRYDFLKDDALDSALRDIEAKGRRAYLVVDDWEEKEFRDRFSPGNRAGRLDWAPLAQVPSRPPVRIYELK